MSTTSSTSVSGAAAGGAVAGATTDCYSGGGGRSSSASTCTVIATIDSSEFYGEYHGHLTSHLETLVDNLPNVVPEDDDDDDDNNRDDESKFRFIWLAGDSSLDNKYWLGGLLPAVNGYETILDPPLCKPDIAYHLNHYLAKTTTTSDKTTTATPTTTKAINCAVEESTLGERKEHLQTWPQDFFLYNNISHQDVLVVSVGGNDVALHPSLATIWNMILMTRMNSIQALANGPTYSFGMNHFINLFKRDVTSYIQRLISQNPNRPPRLVIVCMIYYPDEKQTGSWADKTLGVLGYNDNPAKLQTAIKSIYEHGTSKIRIEGSKVIPLPLFEVMDGKDTTLYEARVEPSATGGELMAKAILDIVLEQQQATTTSNDRK